MDELGYGYRFVSNSTRHARDSVAKRLLGLGYNVAAEQIYTPPLAAMIGDDIQTDVHGAQEMGMQGILVKTGKYREEIVKSSGVKPDMVME